MGSERASQLCFLSGLGLLMFSFAWPRLVGGERAYSDEDAKVYQTASQNLHNVQGEASHVGTDDGHAGESTQARPAEVQAAHETFAALEAKREEAIEKGQTVSLVTKYLAAGVLGLGCVLRWLLRDGQ